MQMTGTTSRTSQSGFAIAKTVLLWILQLGTAAVFIMAAIPKLTGDPQMIAVYHTIGIGQWFRYLTASFEIIGSAALLVPRTAVYGAILLACVAAGATIAHITVLGGSPALPVALLIAELIIIWGRKEQLL